jgi:hypothetical protein
MVKSWGNNSINWFASLRKAIWLFLAVIYSLLLSYGFYRSLFPILVVIYMPLFLSLEPNQPLPTCKKKKKKVATLRNRTNLSTAESFLALPSFLPSSKLF